MTNNIECCMVCAWRENCKKKFTISEGGLNCPDFSEDMTLKKKREEKDEIEIIRNITKHS
jgi:hypothetical protein